MEQIEQFNPAEQMGQMELMKTKEAARFIGVEPGTIHKWVQRYELSCKKNELGHYVFDQSDLKQLKAIKEQTSQRKMRLQRGQDKMDQGAAVADGVRRATLAGGEANTSQLTELMNELAEMKQEVQRLERQVEDKADAVLMVQVLHHRSEMDSMSRRLNRLEDRMEQLLAQKKGSTSTGLEKENADPSITEKRSSKSWFRWRKSKHKEPTQPSHSTPSSRPSW